MVRLSSSRKRYLLCGSFVFMASFSVHLFMGKALQVLVVPEKWSSSLSSLPYFNLLNPIWPDAQPTVLPDCKVVFKEEFQSMRLCHIVPWSANFGDELGPPIIKRILELYFRCSAEDVPTFDLATLGRDFMNRSSANLTKDEPSGPCLFSVGSLWRMVHNGDHLWGTGVAFDGTVSHRCKRDKSEYRILPNNNTLTVYSSRGPLSSAQIHRHCPFAKKSAHTIPTAGDAGFLVPYLFPEVAPLDVLQAPNDVLTESNDSTSKKTTASSSKKLCVIPHHQERNNPNFKEAVNLLKAVRLTVQQSWQNMTRSMLAECKTIIASSLHGIILAEALGIPSKRVRLTKLPGDFKFDDFYQSYRGHTLKDGATTNTLYARNLSMAMNDILQPLSSTGRDAYARQVLETFPIHLFEAVPQ